MERSEKVVGLRGQHVSLPGEVNEALVESLEWLLTAAKSGQINGMAVTYHWNDTSCGNNLVGVTSWTMLGRIERLRANMLRELDDG